MLAAWLHGILNVPRDFLEWPPPAYVLLTDHFASCLGESFYFRSFLPSFLPGKGLAASILNLFLTIPRVLLHVQVQNSDRGANSSLTLNNTFCRRRHPISTQNPPITTNSPFSSSATPRVFVTEC
jgi:hypothetical protein